jgi:putative flippase GtrA
MYCRAQAVLILGSAGDFGVTILLVELFHRPVLLANLAGNITGAILQFIFSRSWVFHANQGNIYLQWIRFILMWAGNFGLSAAGLYLLSSLMGLNYLLAKTIVSVLLGLTYNYIVQKWFVFR